MSLDHAVGVTIVAIFAALGVGAICFSRYIRRNSDPDDGRFFGGMIDILAVISLGSAAAFTAWGPW